MQRRAGEGDGWRLYLVNDPPNSFLVLPTFCKLHIFGESDGLGHILTYGCVVIDMDVVPLRICQRFLHSVPAILIPTVCNQVLRLQPIPEILHGHAIPRLVCTAATSSYKFIFQTHSRCNRAPGKSKKWWTFQSYQVYFV